MKTTDKIIWLDGHITTISSEEAYLRSREVYTDNGSEWVMLLSDSEFVWKNNCWMEREKRFKQESVNKNTVLRL